ncbi:hypothetical protein EHS25_006309 [Saitozyma podzolica]|uniref:Uncharacterized protein n=1 Tax=Saitozyma podzolica TaxID=1890683 RepID=A0A427YRC3_9TREE|nr:hypothetical protein EHS25_006309 [Saitozyma podzolica]
MSDRSSLADHESRIGSAAPSAVWKPEDSDSADPGWTLLDSVQLVPTVFWTAWPVPKTSGIATAYAAAVTSDGTAKSILQSGDVPVEQASAFARALELSVELQAAMKGIVREGSQELPAVSSGDAEVHRLYLGLERDNLSSYDNSALYDKALSDLMASNSEHTNSSHHWLDPIIMSQTFPEFFKDHKPDYSSLASTGQAHTQPAQQSSDADSHRDRSPRDGDWLRAQTPRSTLRDELKIFDTRRRGW